MKLKKYCDRKTSPNKKMTEKKKVIIFKTLGISNILGALFYRATGWRVIFINPIGLLKNESRIKKLSNLGLEWVNYISYEGFNGEAYFKITFNLAEELMERVFNQKVQALLSNFLFLSTTNNQQKCKSLLFNHLVSHILPDSEPYAVAEYFVKLGYNSHVYHPRTLLTDLIFHSGSTSIRNKCHFYGILNILKRLFHALHLFKRVETAYHSRNSINEKKDNSPSQQIQQVICFPHQGIEYGKLFVKDDYYSLDLESPFHMKNILHIELGAIVPNKEYSNIIAGYEKRGIEFEFIENTPLSLKVSLMLFKNILGVMPSIGSRVIISFELMKLIQRVNSYTQSFKHLSGSKIALIGYDWNFPAAASVALNRIGIKTIALQERFISAFYIGHAPIFNYYFVHGNVVAEKYKQHPFAHIDSIIVSGDPRVQKIIGRKEKNLREQKALHQRYRHICLVLDYHSPRDPFENASAIINCWKSNEFFYTSIIELAQNNPSCIFIIRGKDDVWLDVPALQNTLKKILSQSNIKIDNKYDTFDRSYDIASISDIVVSRHTSLSDQCMAAGIKTLVYDELPNNGSILEPWHDYFNYPIYSRTKEELLLRFKDIIQNNAYMPQGKFQEMRKYYYGVSNDNKNRDPKRLIHTQLSKILADPQN